MRREACRDDAERACAQDREPFEAGQVRVLQLALEHRAAHEIEHEPRVVRGHRLQRHERREERVGLQRRRHGLLVGRPGRGPGAVTRVTRQDGAQCCVAGIGGAVVHVHEAREGRGCR